MEKPPIDSGPPDDPSTQATRRVSPAIDGHEPATGKTEKSIININRAASSDDEPSKSPKSDVGGNGDQNEEKATDYSSKAQNKTSFKNYLVIPLCVWPK
jgi:hypothetical protein